MGMDRNTIIGFALLAVLFFGYFYYTRQGQLALEKDQQHITDSIAKIQPKIKTDSFRVKKDSTKVDSLNQNVSGFKQDSVSEQLSVLENQVLKITFTNK